MKTVAVVGAGGLLGREILAALEARGEFELLPLSERMAGSEVDFRGKAVVIEALDDDAVETKPDVVIFATGAERANRWAAKFAAAGSRVVDASSAHRLSNAVTLAGSGASAEKKGLVVAVPGAAPLAAARIVSPVLAAGGLTRLNATLLFPVSSLGQAGVVELSRQTAALLGGRVARPRRFRHRVAFNLIPEVGDADGGDSTLESSFVAELRRLVNRPELPVAATAVRVPVFYGLTLVLAGGGASAAAVRRAVGGAPGVKLLEGKGVYPMPSLSVGDLSVLVGRVRDDGSGGFQLVATVDGFRLVAAAAAAAALASSDNLATDGRR